jgi:hypothetical protein
MRAFLFLGWGNPFLEENRQIFLAYLSTIASIFGSRPTHSQQIV